MARRLYGVSDEVLLERRAEKQTVIMRGAELVAFGSDAANSSQQIIINAQTVIDEINAELRYRNHPLAPPEETTRTDFVTVGRA